MTDKKPKTKKPQTTDEMVDKLYNELKKDYMDKRITDAEYYDLAIKMVIYKKLARIADILEVMSKGKAK
jgi:hypothetical protein